MYNVLTSIIYNLLYIIEEIKINLKIKSFSYKKRSNEFLIYCKDKNNTLIYLNDEKLNYSEKYFLSKANIGDVITVENIKSKNIESKTLTILGELFEKNSYLIIGYSNILFFRVANISLKNNSKSNIKIFRLFLSLIFYMSIGILAGYCFGLLVILYK